MISERSAYGVKTRTATQDAADDAEETVLARASSTRAHALAAVLVLVLLSAGGSRAHHRYICGEPPKLGS